MRASWQTLIAGFLAVALGTSLWGWTATHPDSCSRYLRGDLGQEPSQEVVAGHTTVTVPCQVWLPRQPPAVQALVALDGIFAMVACVSFWADRKRQAGGD